LLVDRAAITDVTIRYCWALDTKDWAVLDTVFTEDANGDLLEDVVGRVAIKKRVETALSRMDETQHLISNHQIVVRGDTATCRCYLQAQHVRKAAHGGPNFIIAGRYEDELKRTADGWRITFRRLVVMWTDGNPGVSRG
jgi:3-phenylpropionate/cinnamic acid dioxygenase small subunit